MCFLNDVENIKGPERVKKDQANSNGHVDGLGFEDPFYNAVGRGMLC